MNKNDNARARALSILEEWHRRGASLDLVVENEMAKPFDDRRDSQLCRALVYGVARWRGYLDAVLARFSKHPLAKMKPLTRQALRIGLYQLLFMDRIPPSAAINELVKILKARKQPRWLTGFVNGLLRRIDREASSLPTPGQSSVSGFKNYELCSHPKWLYERWLSRYGKERTAAICEANNREPDLAVRVTDVTPDEFLAKLLKAGIKAERGLYSEQAVILPGYKGAVFDLPGYGEGLFVVQDQAAQLATALMGKSLIEGRYLDGCAGLGGKTGQLAASLGRDTSLLAVEPDERRYKLLGTNLERLGLEGKVETFNGRIVDIEAAPPGFKGILIDAPCSGLGVIRRHPDIRWNRREVDLKNYQSQQLDLLKDAARLLASSGVLVYLTCSTEPEENEEVVEKFLDGHPDFRMENCRDYLPEPARMLVDRRGFFHPLPDQGLDGFFGVRLVKIGSE